jgi:hypothetical protein
VVLNRWCVKGIGPVVVWSGDGWFGSEGNWFSLVLKWRKLIRQVGEVG